MATSYRVGVIGCDSIAQSGPIVESKILEK